MRTLGIFCALLLTAVPALAKEMKAAAPAWKMNATVIEACSCPTFCQCFFTTSPAGHEMHMEGHEGHAEHYCRFNNAYRVNKGDYRGVKLDGAKFWVYGDLGADFSKGQTDWAVVTFDRSTTKEQRDGIAAILGHLYPVKWNSLTTAEGDVEWVPGKDAAYATLDGGKTAEVRLQRFQGMTNDPIVIRNLKYFGAVHNDGFLVMPNTVEALRVGDKSFEFHGTNGFMITLDIDANTAPPEAGAGN
ncbi:MAG: DUF1326 domain-containing protein [Candidatus Eisenbacteria bacterium]|nr:DUF1326 domain-containing protein [Candidatus Eisenbacteria bacterium]